MKIKPTQNFLHCKLIDTGADGSILIPENASPVQPHALVLDVGPLCVGVKAGDRVLFLPQNMMCTVGKESAREFIMPASAVYAFYLGEDEKEVVLN